jgi:hypothetical protein
MTPETNSRGGLVLVFIPFRRAEDHGDHVITVMCGDSSVGRNNVAQRAVFRRGST